MANMVGVEFLVSFKVAGKIPYLKPAVYEYYLK